PTIRQPAIHSRLHAQGKVVASRVIGARAVSGRRNASARICAGPLAVTYSKLACGTLAARLESVCRSTLMLPRARGQLNPQPRTERRACRVSRSTRPQFKCSLLGRDPYRAVAIQMNAGAQGEVRFDCLIRRAELPLERQAARILLRGEDRYAAVVVL